MKKESVCLEKNYYAIYQSHVEGLRNFMYYRCGDLEKAEDLAQDAFTKLWENCKKVIFEKAKSYLFTTAQRMFLNQVAHEKVVLSFEKDSSNKNELESPDYLLEEKEFKTKLEEAIAELPEGQRTVFLLHKIDKMPFQEIADMQGTSLSAVHKKMYKAVDRLKKSVRELKDKKI